MYLQLYSDIRSGGLKRGRSANCISWWFSSTRRLNLKTDFPNADQNSNTQWRKVNNTVITDGGTTATHSNAISGWPDGLDHTLES